jgi:hypothetical protein
MARDDRILAFRHAVDTIGMVRKLLLSVLVVAAVGTVTWALWPATTWSAAFCKPVVRVVGKDVVAIVSYIYQHNLASYHDLASTPTPTLLRDALVNDVVLAQRHAPTRQLRQELSHYSYELGKSSTLLQTGNAYGSFDALGRTQLRACGVTPIGSYLRGATQE